MVRHLVLGTAGHIDHGKSALVKALSGTDPDRLVEEQRRGITIELGFADVALDAEHIVSFVDVPGHERFVRHMVAGAAGIDAVLLVVAADQGVQPQTREHLEICRLLDVRQGLIALTKCDLVEPDLAQVAALELQELVDETFLRGAPLVQVSARSGEGLDLLRGEILGLFEKIAERPDDGVTRLPVDRSFVLRGFGTVVTGTLVAGRLVEGQEVEVLPRGRRGRVRGVQVHHATVPEARAGRRTAVNLQGLETNEIPRGSTIGLPGTLRGTRRIWARLTLSDGAPRSLKRGGPVRFHQGTAECGAAYRVLFQSGDDLSVELFLDAPTVLVPGDRFILRRPAPVNTVGGGVVVDVDPPARREAVESLFLSDALRPESLLRSRLSRAGARGREPAALAVELGLTPGRVGALLSELESGGTAVRAGPCWVDAGAWNRTRERTLEALASFHEQEPLRTGISREALRQAAGADLSQDGWRLLLEGLDGEGRLQLNGDLVCTAGHSVTLSDADRSLYGKIEGAFRSAGLDPPDWESLAGEASRKRAGKLVDLLVSQGRLVRIHDGKLFHREALDGLLKKLRDFARSSPTIDVGAFKQLAGVTRKNAIPLLEHLDAQRITRRSGNSREILRP